MVEQVDIQEVLRDWRTWPWSEEIASVAAWAHMWRELDAVVWLYVTRRVHEPIKEEYTQGA